MSYLKSLPILFLGLSLLSPPLLSIASESANSCIDIAQFGASGNDRSDSTPALRVALLEIRKQSLHRLVFSPKRYDFWPDRAEEKYMFVSNNDEGLKRIAFYLSGIHDLEIDGRGAQFVFHGYLVPLILDHSQNVSLKNFSVDFERPFSSEAKILGVHENSVDLSFDKQFPYRIEDGNLVFTGEGPDSKILYPVSSLLEFDPVKRETAFEAQDIWLGSQLRATSLGQGIINLILPHAHATVGNTFVFGPDHRKVPGIVISDSDQIRLEGVSVYHAGGMAIVGQRSSNITLDHVQVTPTPGGGRVLSVTADATHFANCSGKIVMTHCLFECQDDDATNIHGIYEQVTKVIGPDQMDVRLVHPQQYGFDFIQPETHLEFVRSGSLATYATGTVKAVDPINKEYERVTFSQPLPTSVITGDVVAQIDAYPDVQIDHCIVRGNRARGFLIGSRGSVVIEDNLFHTAGAAILFEGDGRFWFEQSGVRNVLIRNNTFSDCNYGTWGRATIEVGTGMVSPSTPNRYHRNIVIEGNTFHRFDPRLLLAYSVDGLTFKNNKIESSTDYPSIHSDAEPYKISDSDNILIENQPITENQSVKTPKAESKSINSTSHAL